MAKFIIQAIPFYNADEKKQSIAQKICNKLDNSIVDDDTISALRNQISSFMSGRFGEEYATRSFTLEQEDYKLYRYGYTYLPDGRGEYLIDIILTKVKSQLSFADDIKKAFNEIYL